MSDGAPPYRDDEGWLTKSPDDVSSGPHATDEVARAVRRGALPPTTRVRLESEGEWRCIVDVPELWGEGPVVPPDASPYRRPAPSPNENRAAFERMQAGSLGGGFCAGFFGGCIGLIVVHAIATSGTETRRGAKLGFAVAVAVSILGALAELVIQTVQH